MKQNWLFRFLGAFFFLTSAAQAQTQVPLYDLWELRVSNTNSYINPFADVELNAVFTHQATGRRVDFFGFYDGDGNGGQNGNVWKLRFMPDELGSWSYQATFTDGSPGNSGSFNCVAQGAKPGPWRVNPDNPHWFKLANGEHFLPVATHASMSFAPIDWQNAIPWAAARGFNTILTRTFNNWAWGDGWPNVTPFVTGSDPSCPDSQCVDYSRMNLKMWKEWDEMIQLAAEHGIYIGSWAAMQGKFGGQRKNRYPPDPLVFNPALRESWSTAANTRRIRYHVARQGAFWNLAYWSLGGTEVCIIRSQAGSPNRFEDEQDFLIFGAYYASLTPWNRMITGQDCEQWHVENRRWISALGIPGSRKLNTVQSAVIGGNAVPQSNVSNVIFQETSVNNEFALDSYGGFPVLGTETLWEGQGRANQPLSIIWGFYTAAAHTMWADWRYEDENVPADVGRGWGSIGRGWSPVKPLSLRVFGEDRLGMNCEGDEQLLIAAETINSLEYWKMNPRNDLVAGGAEAYCLAEPGAQYLVYAPDGGNVRVNMSQASGTFDVKWLNPRNGSSSDVVSVTGGGTKIFSTPSKNEWVLIVTASDPSGESSPKLVESFKDSSEDGSQSDRPQPPLPVQRTRK